MALPGSRVLGVDVDSHAIEQASALYSHDRLSYSVLEGDELPELSLDGIVALEVLEHLTNPGNFLAWAHTHLVQDGILTLSTPSALGRSAVLAEAKRRVNHVIGRRRKVQHLALLRDRPYDPATHLGHVLLQDLDTLSALLKASSFTIEDFAFVSSKFSLTSLLFPETIVVTARRLEKRQS